MAARKAAENTEVSAQVVPDETRLDTDVNAPATNAPGDAPHDTTDPTEQASTITPQPPNAEALAAGTILGAVPVPAVVVDQAEGDERVEEYDAVDAHGVTVRVRHYIDGPRAGQSERV